MGIFLIKDLEYLSGIKAHTIRMWEQRYELINPKRTDTNIRHYDDQDLKLLLNVALLNHNGIKISKIAQMSEGEMQRRVLKFTETGQGHHEQIQALTIAMVDLDEGRFERIMSLNSLRLGFENTMLRIVSPFLTKIGTLWQTGSINPAQEHFISNLIRQKLIAAIDSLPAPRKPQAGTYMLYLPEGELHELSLLFAHYVIKARRHKAIYLGQSLPLRDLREVYGIHRPDFLLTVITSPPDVGNVQHYLETVSIAFAQSTIIVTGYQVVGQDMEVSDNILVLNRMDELPSVVEHTAETASPAGVSDR